MTHVVCAHSGVHMDIYINRATFPIDLMDSPLARKNAISYRRIRIIDRDALYANSIKPKNLLPLFIQVSNETLPPLEFQFESC